MTIISERELDYCGARQIPAPRHSAMERLRDLLTFRNSMHLFRTTCAKTGKSILSSTPPQSNLTVYDIDFWSSGEWDASDFGRPYDFSRPFFEQFNELMHCVPFPSLGVIRSTMENSDYTNDITAAKNCYLLFGATENESCLFSHWLWRNREVVDSTHAFDSECCYECRDIRGCHSLLFSDHCDNCFEGAFLSHCSQCSDCFCCTNLAHKRFCIFNEQLSEAQYRSRRAALDLGSFAEVCSLKERFFAFKRSLPLPELEGASNEGSNGNYLRQTKGCSSCFFLSEAQDCEHCIGVVRAKNCLVMASYGDNAELVYMSTGVGDQAYDIRYSWECWMNVSNLEYCMYTTTGCSNCFGCIGLKHKSYCILNKQHSREQYQELLPRIRAHMRASGEYGKFFPAHLSPHAYNQSWADHFMPLSEPEAQQRGFRWAKEADTEEAVSELPDHISDAQDSVLEAVFRCNQTGKRYRLNRLELDFYRKVQVPLPRVAPLERIRTRAAQTLIIRDIRETVCSNCAQAVATAQPPGKILCLKCFHESR